MLVAVDWRPRKNGNRWSSGKKEVRRNISGQPRDSISTATRTKKRSLLCLHSGYFLFHHEYSVDQLLIILLSNLTVYRDGRDMLMLLDISAH